MLHAARCAAGVNRPASIAADVVICCAGTIHKIPFLAVTKDHLLMVAERLEPDSDSRAKILWYHMQYLLRTMQHREILRKMLQGTDEEIRADMDAFVTICG